MSADAKQTQINCISCKLPDDDEKRRTFYEDCICRAVLRTDNQCWLGRYIIVPKSHCDPLVFWTDPIAMHVMKVHTMISRAIKNAFGAVCVQMAQLGGLTVDENSIPTFDQAYQHAHVHGIPRYAIDVPFLAGKYWPDPQFQNGKFSALNIDPSAGLPKIVPTRDEVAIIIANIKRHIQQRIERVEL